MSFVVSGCWLHHVGDPTPFSVEAFELTPLVPHEPGLFVNAEALILRPRRGAFDFAVVSPTTGLATVGPIQSLNYDISAGVRAGRAARRIAAGACRT